MIGEDDRAVCLVQPEFAELARSRLASVAAGNPELQGRIELVEGDVTLPDLGLGAGTHLKGEVTDVFHLAAIYDLEVSFERAHAVNVDGTRNVLNFAAGCEHLQRLQYVSTCFVSGRHAGVFRERDLHVGQSFNNAYEETKYLAEAAVHRRIDQNMPVTIYRPAVVVGDSDTGATQKLDGPYLFIRLLLRQPKRAVMPVVGDPTMVRANVVPRDFVVDAIAHLCRAPEAVGKIYQLADPRPLRVDEMLEEVAQAADRRIIRVRVPRSLAKAALRHVPGLERLLGIPPAALDYFVHPTHYTTENASRDLEGTGIRVPAFTSYVERLVEFVRENPRLGSEAMA